MPPTQVATRAPASLQRQLARGRDHQRERLARRLDAAVLGEQLAGHGHAEGDGLARAGLGRDDEVAAMGLGLENGGLDRGGLGITARAKRVAKGNGQILERHSGARWR
jgi:hypothetical protein